MAPSTTKRALFTDIRQRIQQHRVIVATIFQPLQHHSLQWTPNLAEWNIEQCFDHLTLTHAYYHPKIDAALVHPHLAHPIDDRYTASFWGRIYMAFAFNPRYSFPTDARIIPLQVAPETVLHTYLATQDTLIALLDRLATIDLRHTRVQIEKGVHFNLGDCLTILVHHDALHIAQAQRVLRQYHHAYPTPCPPDVR